MTDQDILQALYRAARAYTAAWLDPGNAARIEITAGALQSAALSYARTQAPKKHEAPSEPRRDA